MAQSLCSCSPHTAVCTQPRHDEGKIKWLSCKFISFTSCNQHVSRSAFYQCVSIFVPCIIHNFRIAPKCLTTYVLQFEAFSFRPLGVNTAIIDITMTVAKSDTKAFFLLVGLQAQRKKYVVQWDIHLPNLDKALKEGQCKELEGRCRPSAFPTDQTCIRTDQCSLLTNGWHTPGVRP